MISFNKNPKNNPIDIAITLQKSEKFEEAKAIYNSLLKENKNNFQALYLLGTLEAQCSNYNKAILFLSKANKINSNSWEINHNLGNAYFEISDYKKAKLFYKKSIKINNNNEKIYYKLGLTYKKLEEYSNALAVFEQAIIINPSYTNSILESAIIFFQIGKKAESFQCFEKIIKIDSNNSFYYFHYGAALVLCEKYLEAIPYLEKSINIKNDFPDAYLSLGDAFHGLRDNQNALKNYQISININNNVIALFNISHTYMELKKYEEALFYLREVLIINPEFDQAYNAIGVVYIHMGYFDLAYQNLTIAIELNSKEPSYFLNRGNTLASLKKFDDSTLDYLKAIEIKPDYAEAYCNHGYLLLNNMFRPAAALVLFDVAVGLNPNFTKALVNRAECFVRLNEYEKALNDFLKALEADPESEYTLGKCLHYKMKICDWNNLNEGISICQSMLESNMLVAVPFETLNFLDNPRLHMRSSELFINHKARTNSVLGEIVKYKPKSIIKIGYYSADLYSHPVSIWLAEQLENHDKTKVELYAFCLKSVQDPMRDRLEAAFDHWIDVTHMSDLEVAKLSREHEIDVAIDLNGHTGDGRPGIFAARAAPIQVSHLGFPGTMGAEYIDYIICNAPAQEIVLEPREKNRQFVTEKIAYVPSNFTYDRQRKLSEEPLTRAKYGLPETGFVFTCQNGCQKLMPEVFGIWMEILKAVPGSVLWLLMPNELAKSNLIKEANARGVEEVRLIFTAREVVSMDQERARIGRYLASYKLADLFLDTWPYNAGTTAVDALWAGLPVLTKTGQSMVARMATEALEAIKVPELVTKTPDEYKGLAIELAHNPDKLKQLRDKVLVNRLTTTLFDPVSNTRHIENAYLEMYRRYQEDIKLEDFTISF